MSKPLVFLIAVCLAVLTLTILALPVAATPAGQTNTIPTPTPGPDGRIVYIAQDKDTAWRIAAIYGIPLEQLRDLNQWGENPIIHAGDVILLGFAGPATAAPTIGPTATPRDQLPTPSPVPGFGKLCVLLYNDLNGDSMRQEDEASIPRGSLSITNRAGTVSESAETGTGLDPICYEDLAEGGYNISVGVPDGYNETTVMNMALTLTAGDTSYAYFGAQAKAIIAEVEAPVPEASGKSPGLAILGGALLLVGVGLGLFAGKLTRGSSLNPRGSKPAG